MDYKSFIAHIELNDGLCCPYCGQGIEQINIMFAKYYPDGPRVMFGYGGCCDAAHNILFELPANTALSYATLPAVLDVIRGKLDMRRRYK